MRKLSMLFIIIAMLSLAITPSFAQEEPGTIAEVVTASTTAETPEFTVLLAAVGAADPALLELLSDPEAGVTVFAPTDAAFAAAFEALGVTPADVLADPDLLNAILAYHVVPTVLSAEDVVALDGAYVGTFLPEMPLMISVGDDDSVLINESTVVAADVAASNGVVHVIDSVLVPDMEALAAMAEGMSEMEAPTVTLGEVALGANMAETPEFTTLVAAVTAADPAFLAAATGTQPLTIFAPTDAAFAAAFEALGVAPEDLLADTETLNGILAYHILPGQFSAATLIALASESEEGIWIATALPGYAVNVMSDGETVTVDGANVVMADVYGTNGVIHAIDGVLLPDMEAE